MKSLLFFVKALAFLVIFGYFVPKFTILMTVCGLYDVLRNRDLKLSTVNRYFFGNGALTWLLSPFNTFLDALALPYWNKGVYKIEDLPAAYQDEINRLIETAHRENLIAKIEERAKEQKRTMVFWKWYGSNIDTFLDVPAYHEPYKYIRTIGISVFNKKQSTSKHYGPLRPTLRVLYNINKMEDRSAYIEVGDVKHYWQDEQLFIFDDTLQHQSFNETDKVRYCLFVDVLRPSVIPQVFSVIVDVVRFFLKSVNYIFYRNWTVIKN